MSPPGLTSSQTIGPFFHDAMLRPDATRHFVGGPASAGERIRLEGRVLDADAVPVQDAMVEIWQANHEGQYGREDFLGFGRSGTDAEGRYWFETTRPGRVAFDAARQQAPHVSVAIFARGLLNHLFTRVYFADDPSTAGDPVLALVPEARRTSLLARPSVRDGQTVYTFDIALSGDGETVFFDYRAPNAPGDR